MEIFVPKIIYGGAQGFVTESKFKPRLVLGGRSVEFKRASDYQEITIDKSNISECRAFSEAEILGLILQIAKAEGIKKDQLEIEQKAWDSSGSLVGLSVRVAEGRALGSGWRSIEYDYMIQGQHGDFGEAQVSLIARIYNSGNPCKTEGAIVAEHINNQWDIKPGIEPLAHAGRIKLP